MKEPNSKNIYQRFLEVQKKVTTVHKKQNVQVGKNKDDSYKAVKHDDVAALLHEPLTDAGIVMLPNVESYAFSEFEVEKQYNNQPSYKQRWYRTDIKIKVRWINADDPSDFFESDGAAFALDTSDKSFAKAYSLALKIVLLKVHLLESCDNEEERNFENETQNAKSYSSNRNSERMITDKQVGRLWAIAKKAHFNGVELKELCLSMCSKENPRNLTIVEYNEVIDVIQNHDKEEISKMLIEMEAERENGGA